MESVIRSQSINQSIKFDLNSQSKLKIKKSRSRTSIEMAIDLFLERERKAYRERAFETVGGGRRRTEMFKKNSLPLYRFLHLFADLKIIKKKRNSIWCN